MLTYSIRSVPLVVFLSTILFLANGLPVFADASSTPAYDQGLIPFGNGSADFSTDPSLFWDAITARLGLGTSSPLYPLSVVGDGYFQGSVFGRLLDMGGHTFNVQAYGAIGDGATDDTAAVNAAYAAAAPSHGTVFFPCGTYQISNTIQDADSVSWEGVTQQCSVVRLTPQATVDMFIVTSSNVSFKNLTLDANHNSLTSQGIRFTHAPSVGLENITTDSLTVKNAGDWCLTWGPGTGVATAISNLLVKDSTFTACGGPAVGGISTGTMSASNMSFINNTIGDLDPAPLQLTAQAHVALYIGQAALGTYTNIHILNNRVRFPILPLLPNSTYQQESDGVVVSTGGRAGSTVSSVTISNNIIEGTPEISSNDSHAIELWGVEKVLVSNNIVTNASNALVAQPGSAGSPCNGSITGNSILHPFTGTGVVVAANCQFVIQGNQIRAIVPLQVAGGGVSIAGNYLVTASSTANTVGLSLKCQEVSCAGTSVSGNTIVGGGGAFSTGILIGGASGTWPDLNITGNAITGTSAGISANGAVATGTIANNTISISNPANRYLYIPAGMSVIQSINGNTGIGTTTPNSLFSVGDITFSTSGGINLKSGCFALNGVCLGGGSASSSNALIGNTGQFVYFNATNTPVGTSALFLSPNNNVGIGTVAPTEKLQINGNAFINGSLALGGTVVNPDIGLTTSLQVADPTTDKIGAFFSRTLALTAPSARNITGGAFAANISANNSNHTGNLTGGLFQASSADTATVSTLKGGSFLAYNTGAGTVTNAFAGYAAIQNLVAGGTIVNAYGQYIGGGFNNGTINNLYGLYVDTLPNAGAVYGVYVKNTKSYFGNKVGIGTPAPDTLLTVGSAAATGNVAHFQNATGSCYLDPATSALSCSSDQRLKTNIASLADSAGLDALLELQPVTYNWKTEVPGTPVHNGFIAQDVLPVFPTLISKDSDGFYSMNYTGLIPSLVKAIQVIGHVTGTFRDALIAWIGSSDNGIENLYARTGHFEQIDSATLCAKTSIGTSVCVTGDQLAALLKITSTSNK